ncbi:hypothetical protein WN51_12649 [Melipona quadrifasciata]|uniref:Uncharacterized protein n=1 Tax=Melipona quadrifasciata TaxID=166423 RepID=A0A0M9A0N2_9HYME|nr:hypothetical protein WN51_12649 [Melipona quadrifasciata]
MAWSLTPGIELPNPTGILLSNDTSVFTRLVCQNCMSRLALAVTGKYARMNPEIQR